MGNRLSSQVKAHMREEHAAGMSYNSIARKHKCAPSTAYRIITSQNAKVQLANNLLQPASDPLQEEISRIASVLRGMSVIKLVLDVESSTAEVTYRQVTSMVV